MIYKVFKDKQISQLGFGCMRLPTVTPDTDVIDEKEAARLIAYAYENGVNFFDTAYFYNSGDSQRVLGRAVSDFPRDSYYLANKMPGNFMYRAGNKIRIAPFGTMREKFVSDAAEVFEDQLKECSAEYFDFYMLHNVCEQTYALYTDEELGIIDYLLEQKKAGRIRHLGFSSHAYPDTLERFLNWRGDCFEYALIQLNYLDWDLQEADKKYNMLTERGLSVFAMEPVRGGNLAKPSKKATEILKTARPDDTPVSWAFRFLQGLPNLVSVVSGMSTMEQIKENIELFSKDDPITETENAALKKAIENMSDFAPCTSCRYCANSCPQSLDIPHLMYLYNELCFEKTWLALDGYNALSEDKKPSNCTACGLCKPFCPQNIDIPNILSRFPQLLEKK